MGPSERGLRWALVTLCLTQITSWGVLYYAFSVLSVRIADQTGWSRPAVTAAFSGALVTSALVGIMVGRWLDRHGPHGVMTVGAVIGPLAVGGVALAPTFAWFVAAWVAAGLAMGAVLYPPAFAALTRWFGARHMGALTILTLAAGLSSTVFAPLTATLAARFDWRTTYLVLAGLLAIVTIPAHFFGLRQPWPPPSGVHITDPPSRIAQSRSFFALAVALTLGACASYAVIVNLVPLMGERGIDARGAAAALSMGGIGQVLGRLGYRTLVARVGVRARIAVILAGVASTTALLGVFRSVAALIIVAVLAGFARGIMTLLQATAITERWGPAHYGHLNGLLSAPITVATAISPWIGSALASELGGYAPMFLALGAFGAAAVVISVTSVPARPPANDPLHLSTIAHTK
ncbi:integral membrane transporter [Mycobacterium lentiflavum]|nr:MULTISPECIES: MFS transporter [Mycobacterium simiae complex]ULP45544.1 MFS transporter [Mycobacterium lentiflavum]CDO91627.1 integral membrane transporter [Mycobacterium triplex]CQD24723.1 integral membrane transporter [Mycobacterium lentiflavum]